MRFPKRQVKSILVTKDGNRIYFAEADTENKIITVFAHEDDETNSQLLGIESVNKLTGEVCTQRINLPITDMYMVSVIEILEIQE